jgi:hypothetical protein
MIRNDSRLPLTRVFTLAVGPHPIPTTNMRNISCFAHGLHAAVINYGAIPTKVRVGQLLPHSHTFLYIITSDRTTQLRAIHLHIDFY